jgi:enterochelin esterase-like enzyme
MPFIESRYRVLAARESRASAGLSAGGFTPIFMKFAGAHQWKVWRHSLNDFALRLFR